MRIDTREIASISAANQNFTSVAKIADKFGKAVIFKNNRPKYVLIDIHGDEYFNLTDDEKIEIAARRVMERCRQALVELAK